MIISWQKTDKNIWTLTAEPAAKIGVLENFTNCWNLSCLGYHRKFVAKSLEEAQAFTIKFVTSIVEQLLSTLKSKI